MTVSTSGTSWFSSSQAYGQNGYWLICVVIVSDPSQKCAKLMAIVWPGKHKNAFEKWFPQFVIWINIYLIYLFFLSFSLPFNKFQSPELEFRHELMGRINKLESDVELDVVPINQHHPSSGGGSPPLSHHAVATGLASVYGGQGHYDHYGKEFFFGKFRVLSCCP